MTVHLLLESKDIHMDYDYYFYKLYYSVYNQCEPFICLDLMVKNKKISIER
jgi:hypothetical protein